MNVVLFHVDVANDLNEASQWYERRKPGLGRAFRDAFEKLLGRVVGSPLRFAPVEEDMRCARLKKFSYGIFTSTSGEVADPHMSLLEDSWTSAS